MKAALVQAMKLKKFIRMFKVKTDIDQRKACGCQLFL